MDHHRLCASVAHDGSIDEFTSVYTLGRCHAAPAAIMLACVGGTIGLRSNTRVSAGAEFRLPLGANVGLGTHVEVAAGGLRLR